MNRNRPVADYTPNGIAILRSTWDQFCDGVRAIRVPARIIIGGRMEDPAPRMVNCRLCGDRYPHGWFGYVDIGICPTCALPFQRISVKAFRAHFTRPDRKPLRYRHARAAAPTQVLEQALVGEQWFDLARIVGDLGPSFRYGRPWQEHVPARSRLLIRDSA